MKKLTPGAQRALKFIHLLAASVWLTGVLLMWLMPWLVDRATGDGEIRMFIRLYHFVDLQVLTPAAVLTALTGLVYSVFTAWGFKKHGWILLKWAISLGLILWGTFHLGPAVEALLAWSRQGHTGLASDPRFLADMRLSLTAATLNSLLMLVAVGVSVYKPWKNLGAPGK